MKMGSTRQIKTLIKSLGLNESPSHTDHTDQTDLVQFSTREWNAEIEQRLVARIAQQGFHNTVESVDKVWGGDYTVNIVAAKKAQ